MKLSELKKLEGNPRTIKKEDMDRLIKSIEKFGVIEGRPFLVSNRTGENIIIGGNQRYEACKKLGIKEVPVHIMEGLTEEEEREIIIRDNISNGEWDMEMLASEWDADELKDWGVCVTVEPTEDEKKAEIEDNVPEVDETKIIVTQGDIFQLGEHRLMCGDSMDEENIIKLLEGRDADTITHCISDPPYGIAYNPDKHGMIKNDDTILDYTGLAQKYTNGYFCMWTGYQVLDTWMKIVKDRFKSINNVIIWHKGGGGMGDCARSLAQDYEILIVVNRGNFIQGYRGSSTWYWNEEEKEKFIEKASKELLKQVLQEITKGESIWKVSKDNTATYIHPTQKPIEINERVIENFTARGEQILDLFGGSGSNLITAEKTGRKMYMMELDEKYIQVILKRYYEYTDGKKDIKCLNRELDLSEILIDNFTE